MKREDKNALIESLKSAVEQYNHFYVADISGLNAKQTYLLRKKCFEKDIELIVVKNTFFRKALERIGNGVEELYPVKELNQKSDKPLFKGAYAEESIYVGQSNLEALASLKSKEELIGDVILLLQSPMKTVLGQLESGKNLLGGLVKTLSERE